jgi:hypothetical protein
MEQLFLALKREGESEDAIKNLKNLDSRPYVVTSAIGKVARDILVAHVRDVDDIETEYYPPFATSYASDHREEDAEGQGPGVVRNYQVCMAFVEQGHKLPMNGMLFLEGNFLIGYPKCLNYMDMATTLGKPAAKVLVVLLSNALIRSAACLFEIHTALQNNIPLILLPLEDRIHWKAAEGVSEPWPLKTCQPVLAGVLPDWPETKFALNRGTVLEHLRNQNTYPPPGNVAREWAKNRGKDLLDRVVKQAAKKAGLTESGGGGGGIFDTGGLSQVNVWLFSVYFRSYLPPLDDTILAALDHHVAPPLPFLLLLSSPPFPPLPFLPSYCRRCPRNQVGGKAAYYYV